MMPPWLGRSAAALPARWRAVRSRTPGADVKYPVVGAVSAAVVLLGALLTRPLTGALPPATAARWAWSAEAVSSGQWWRIFTAIPLTRDPFMLASMMASLVVAVGALELLAGHQRAAVIAGAGAVMGYLGVTAALLVLRAAGLPAAERWAATLDYGASAGVAACAGAISGLLGNPWASTALACVIVGGVILHHQVADWEHAVAFIGAHLVIRPPTADP